MSDFIGIYDDVLDADFCAHLIEKFEHSEHKHKGLTGHGVDLAKKDSLDITINQHPDWRSEFDRIGLLTLQQVMRYAREYPFLLVGSLASALKDSDTGEMKTLGHEDVAKLPDETLAMIVRRLYRVGSINLQKYDRGRGGYHHWHSELYPHPRDPANDTLHRVLLFMYYLNDVEQGGQTSFFFQDNHVAPRRGRMVIAPAGFTHTHKGQVPESGDKYILTSWIMFRRSEQIYTRSAK